MKNRDISIERFSDVIPVDEISIYPGQNAPFDLALFYPSGIPL